MRGEPIKKRNFGLDILRVLAITFVLIAHGGGYMFPANIADPGTLFFGFVGVELFFVLSGFLIGTILIRTYATDSFNLYSDIKTFWVRRWFRTLPNYYLVLILYFIVYFLIDSTFYLSEKKYFLFFVFLQNTFTPQPHFFNHAWSLAIEEWFYLSFPLILLASHFVFKRSKRTTTFLSICIFALGCLFIRMIFAWKLNLYWDSGFRKVMPLRLDAIAFGVLAAFVKYYYNSIWLKRKFIFFIIGVAGIFILLSYYIRFYIIEKREDLFLRTFFFSFFSICIAFTLPFIESIKSNKESFTKKIITHLSITSYSIYLIHPLVVIILYTRFFNTMSDLTKLFLFLSSTLLISTLQYFYFEKPMTDLRDKQHLRNIKTFS